MTKISYLDHAPRKLVLVQVQKIQLTDFSMNSMGMTIRLTKLYQKIIQQHTSNLLSNSKCYI